MFHFHSIPALLLVLILQAVSGPFCLSSEQPVRYLRRNPTIIDLSWSMPDTNQYASHLKELEKHCPVTGLVIKFHGTPRMVDGKKFIPGTGAWGKIAWRYEDFRQAIARYKSVQSSKFKDNFFYTVTSPGDADWFSDKDWATVAGNYGLAARIAKETGMRGILFDIEQYRHRFWVPPFDKHSYTFEEVCAVARKRGREWGRAVFSAYPDITIFGLTMFSSHGSARMVRPFFNGIMDVMPPTATMIDGHETEGYRARCESDYQRMMCDKYHHFVQFAEPENRVKYSQQVKLGPAYYMDAIYADPVRGEKFCRRMGYRFLSQKEDRMKFFRNNLLAGLLHGDGYIWFYNEHTCWYNLRNMKFFTTLESLDPGITRMVENFLAPEKIDISRYTNIAGDCSFTDDSGQWKFWQIQEDQKLPVPGSGWAAGGRLNVKGATGSSWHQKNVKVTPGAMYLFRAQMRHAPGSHGVISMRVSFKCDEGYWLSRTDKTHTWWIYESTDGQWNEMNRLVVIPDDVNEVQLDLQAGGMRKKDVISFRKIFFGEIPLR